MTRILVLISGTGRNLQAMIDATASGAVDAEIVAVISNRRDAGGLARARAANIPALCIAHGEYASRTAFETELARRIDGFHPDIIALAGFMRILGDDFVRKYEGRLLNIHPSLLPRHRGLQTHQRALDAGDAWHGASVHFVTPELDGGPVILQGRLAVKDDDSADTLAERVMREIELQIYPQVLAWFAQGRLRYADGCAVFNGEPLKEPLQLETLVAAGH